MAAAQPIFSGTAVPFVPEKLWQDRSFLNVSDEKLTERLSGRRVCLTCGGTYHVSTLNGRTDCEKCGAELIQRNDDKAETVLSRLAVYHAQTAPLIDFYKNLGLLKAVDGAQPMDECYAAILEALGAK